MLRARRASAAILCIALATAAAASVLPDDPYQRWQLLAGTIHARTRWIYERCHFDPTPIDVAFVGPSRMSAAVNAPRLGRELAALGLPSQTVNFSLPETGRDINYAVVEQMLERKRPRLLVLGVIEKPARVGHPGFKYVAPAAMVADPGYLGNLDWPGNLLYLPFRQMRLFLARLAPGVVGLARRFDPSRYPGSSLNTTGDVVLPDGTIKNGHAPAAPAELARGVRKLEAGSHPPILPRQFADIEFGDERHYVRRIVEMARARNVRVAFLALPYYSGPSGVQEASFYEQYGPLWNAGFLATHAEWYGDYGHLTSAGAQRLTDWLTDRVADALRPTPALGLDRHPGSGQRQGP